MPPRIPLLAHLERHIEEHRLDLALPGPSHLEIRPPLLRREIGSVDIRHRPSDRQPLRQQISQRLEHPCVDRLIGLIVRQKPPYGVRGESVTPICFR